MGKKLRTRTSRTSSGERKNRKARRAEMAENRHKANVLIVEGYKGVIPEHLSGKRPSKVARWIVKNGGKN